VHTSICRLILFPAVLSRPITLGCRPGSSEAEAIKPIGIPFKQSPGKWQACHPGLLYEIENLASCDASSVAGRLRHHWNQGPSYRMHGAIAQGKNGSINLDSLPNCGPAVRPTRSKKNTWPYFFARRLGGGVASQMIGRRRASRWQLPVVRESRSWGDGVGVETKQCFVGPITVRLRCNGWPTGGWFHTLRNVS